MRETDFGASGGNLENLPQTITEVADDEKHSAVAMELQPLQRRVKELEAELAACKKDLESETEEFKLYKQRAHAVLKKKNDQIAEMTSDDGIDTVTNKLGDSQAKVELLESNVVELTDNLSKMSKERDALQVQVDSSNAEIEQLRSICSTLEDKCETFIQKEKTMLKELQVSDEYLLDCARWLGGRRLLRPRKSVVLRSVKH